MAVLGLRFSMILGLGLLLGCQSVPTDPSIPVVRSDPAVTLGEASSQLGEDLAWLTADAQEGRGLGSAGLERSARWLATRFAEVGLQPGTPTGFLQPFETTTRVAIAKSSLASSSEDLVLQPEADFLPLMVSESGAFEGELVFVGYGIRSPSDEHDDYAAFDVRDKVVVVLEGRPEKGRLGGAAGIPFLRRRAKIATAREQGARAVLFVTDQEHEELDLHARVHSTDPNSQAIGIFALRMTSRAARLLMDVHGPRLDLLREKAREGGRAQATLGVRVEGEVEIQRTRGRVANVVGWLPGHDPTVSDEAIVIGAHYDHLGLGEFGSLSPERRGEIHSGADDNASGTAALLRIAKELATVGPLRRSVVFVAFTAEETGLLGSAYYVANPEAGQPKTIAMLNMDMVGRLRDERLVVFGSESAEAWAAPLAAAAEALQLELAFEGSGPGPSDQTSFYVEKIPVLHFFTGTHSGYHTPDDLPEALNLVGLKKIAGLVERVVRDLAEALEKPVFAGQPVSLHGSAGSGPGYGPDLGTIPAFGGEPVIGVRISGVRAGSPAEKAGLTGGDIIVSFAGTSVRDLAEFAALLFSERAGRTVAIRVLRDGEPLEFQATLGRRR